MCWQSVFPDRRDCLILSSLPVRTSSMIAAKLTALGVLFLGAWVAINLATTLLFPVAAMRYMSAGSGLRFYFAHVAAVGAASAFVFLLALASQALLALTFSAAALLYGFAYVRLMRRTIEESGAVGSGTARPWRWGEWILDRTLLRGARERQTFYFIWRTMTRNRGHRLILAAYSAVGLLYIATGISSVVKRSGGEALLAPNAALSALPLILPFFMLLGMRASFAFPVELPSNWIFRITDAGRPDDHVRAARKQMLVTAVLPVCLIGLPAYGLLWGGRIAAMHVLMSLFASMGMLEWMMAGFRKAPFTCPWMPGKGNLKVAFGAWVVLFLASAYLLIQLELALARSPMGSVIGAGAAVLFWAHRLRKRRAEESPDVPVMWEEPPVWFVQTLDLSR